ncbi:MAG TPA: ribonuclease P protein component 1 [Candidatus Acidoferrales bacterium]|nr:ribonuclease P protein component 1 [Candidatus Acidoferrales bacterium]
MITPYNLLRHELIGLNVRVLDALNPSVNGIHGSVLDETKNTLTIGGIGESAMIPKAIATFRFQLPTGIVVDVDGTRLTARPENRLKTRTRRW